jgi:type II secretory pathway predicted ATPase ExeA
MNQKLLSLYGLKWNPFAPEVPVEALYARARLESFCWRVEQLVGEGGFALVSGLPGVGKSVTLRVLAERLSAQRDVQVGVLSRPQAHIADSTASSAICSACRCTRITAGAERSCCASAGKPRSTPRCAGRY